MKSVLIVTNSHSGGGAERSMNVLAQSFYDIGLTTVLVSINSGNFDLVKPNCRQVNLNRSINAGFFETLRIARQLRSLAKDFLPDAILLNCDLPEFVGLFLPVKRNVFIVEHTSKPFFNRKVFGFFIRICHSARGAFFVAINPSVAIWPFRLQPSFVIKNSVNPKLVEVHEPTRDKPSSQSPRLIFIGRLSHEKDPQLFVEIVRSIGIPSLIIGDGPLYSKIESTLPPSSLMLGQVTNPWREISTSDILIVTSRFEGDGLVVVEGLLNRIPIILRDVPDLRRFNLPNYNYAIDSNDFRAQIMLHLKGSVDLVPPEEVYLRTVKERDPKSIALSWIQEIEQLQL